MSDREREHATLSFGRPGDRGAVEETFYPWDLTVERFAKEGLPADLARRVYGEAPVPPAEKYVRSSHFEGTMDYERWLGFDAVRRLAFVLPLLGLEREVLEDDAEHTLYRGEGGRVISLHKKSGVAVNVRYAVTKPEDWSAIEEIALGEQEQYYRSQDVAAICIPLRDGQARGEYSVRLHVEGFYWTPRELLGTENVSYTFYDNPELIHRINRFCLGVFTEHLAKVLEVVAPDVLYIMEDISGVNGPLISPRMFEEFVAPYYRELVPMLRDFGVRHVLVDTDGDFRKLIPSFIGVGVDGFLPMDVNAGMDIVAVRQEFPRLQFIGGFNKLCIADGKAAIDRELDRLAPVIRQGGYLPGADHQVAPSTSLEHYRYYIDRLREAMVESGFDVGSKTEVDY